MNIKSPSCKRPTFLIRNLSPAHSCRAVASPPPFFFPASYHPLHQRGSHCPGERRGRVFRAAHLNFAEFTLLETYLHTSLLRSRKHPETRPNRPARLTSADKLLLWLFYLCGDRTSQLTMHFGFPHLSTIFRYVDHVSWCMNDTLSECIAWPTRKRSKGCTE